MAETNHATGDRTGQAAGQPVSGGPVAGTGPSRHHPAASGPEQVMPAELAELHDRWLRAVAELDNLRKRFERDLTDQVRAERARVTAAFLPVLDNLELALRHADADPASIVAGVQAIYEQAQAVLAGLGYRRVDETGVQFDPARHLATQVIPTAEAEPGSVVSVQRPGYADADGRLVRPAAVAVASQPASAGPGAATPPGDDGPAGSTSR